MIINAFLWTTLALIVICVRLYTRAIVVKRLGLDDWLMTGAMVSHCSLCLMIESMQLLQKLNHVSSFRWMECVLLYCLSKIPRGDQIKDILDDEF
jgi:hypothetical protein